MNCQQRQLDYLRKGESRLSRRERRHIENCPDCRQFITALTGLESQLKEVPSAEPSRRVDAMIRDQARRPNPTAERSAAAWPFRQALSTAVLAGILSLGLTLWWLGGSFISETDPGSEPIFTEKTDQDWETAFTEAMLEAEIEHWASFTGPESEQESTIKIPEPVNYLEEQLWELEAELLAEYMEMQQEPELWYAEVK